MTAKKAIIAAVAMLSLLLSACTNSTLPEHSNSSNVESIDSPQIIDASQAFTERDQNADYEEDSAVIIDVSDDKLAQGVTVSNGIITISKAGVYILRGNSTDKRIVIDAGKQDTLQIILDNVSIHCDNAPVLYVKSASKVIVTLASDSKNTLSDGNSYNAADIDNADGVIFSKSDLTINGNGTLTVSGNYKHGIVSKDELTVMDGNLHITAVKTALYGKDAVKIGGGKLELFAEGNGIHSANTEDAAKGFTYISDGIISVESSGDGIQAESFINIVGGDISIKTGGGAEHKGTISSDVSTKGIKAIKSIAISGGAVEIDSVDDGIHSNESINIANTTLKITTGDDGIHADNVLTIDSGSIEVTKSYEGLEGADIIINGGRIIIDADDDGINAASGSNSPFERMPPASSGKIEINGGYIYVNADGDGIDSNGDLKVNGGILLVCGPSDSGNGALDYDGTAEISGGIVIALGSSGMAQNFTSAQNQGSILASFSNQQAGTYISLCDSDGNIIVSLKSAKAFNSALISTPAIKTGSTYTICASTSIEGEDANGFAENGKASDIASLTTVNMTSLIYGSGFSFGGNRPGGPGGFGGGMRPPR